MVSGRKKQWNCDAIDSWFDYLLMVLVNYWFTNALLMFDNSEWMLAERVMVD